MIPGFCSAYVDNDNFRHLYFFQGINEDGKPIYNYIDLSNIDFKYDEDKHLDGSIDYKFYDKTIIKIKCKLVKYNSSYDIIIVEYE